MAPFDRSHTSSYSPSIVTIGLGCIVSKLFDVENIVELTFVFANYVTLLKLGRVAGNWDTPARSDLIISVWPQKLSCVLISAAWHSLQKGIIFKKKLNFIAQTLYIKLYEKKKKNHAFALLSDRSRKLPFFRPVRSRWWHAVLSVTDCEKHSLGGCLAISLIQ